MPWASHGIARKYFGDFRSFEQCLGDPIDFSLAMSENDTLRSHFWKTCRKVVFTHVSDEDATQNRSLFFLKDTLVNKLTVMKHSESPLISAI